MSFDDGLPVGLRRTLYVAFCILILVLVLTLFSQYLKGAEFPFSGLVSAVNENVIAGLIAAFGLAVLYRAVGQWVDPRDRVLEVNSDAITNRLLRNASKTRSYTFVGNTATFVASSIIPLLCAVSRKTGRSQIIRIFVINPLMDEVVDAYVLGKGREMVAGSRGVSEETASWVRPLPSPKVSETPVIAKAKIVSCIYLCAYAAKHSGISVELYLRSAFTPFRADITDREVILTQESASEPAVAFSAEGVFYGWYQKEVESLVGQCLRVDLMGNRDIASVVVAHPTSDAKIVKGALEKLLERIFPGRTFSSEVIDEAVKKITFPSHSYQR